jgi:hypothetical protein
LVGDYEYGHRYRRQPFVNLMHSWFKPPRPEEVAGGLNPISYEDGHKTQVTVGLLCRSPKSVVKALTPKAIFFAEDPNDVCSAARPLVQVG